MFDSPTGYQKGERFSKYAITFRKKVYRDVLELQTDLDRWMDYYNNERTHNGKYYFGKTLMQTFTDSIQLAKTKLLEYLVEDQFVSHPSFSRNSEENTKLPINQFEENKLYSQNTSDNI